MTTARQLSRAREPAGLTSWLSAAEVRSLLEFAHRCVCCRTKGDFLALMPWLQSVVPFEHAYAISLRRDVKRGVIAPTDSIDVSFPEEFSREYASRDYFQVDPIMWRSFTSHGARHCSVEGMEIGRPREVKALCLDFGLRQGYVLGSGSKEDWSVFFFKGPSMKPDRHLAAVLEFAAPHLEMAYSCAVQGERAPADVVALSDREREVLAWLQEGKSSWEMAVILGIGERTANFHVANLRRKLGAVNRSQALAIAARLGLLGP